MAAPAPIAVAGPSSVVMASPSSEEDDDMPALIPEEEVAHAGYGDDLSEETQMGPA